MASSVTAVEEGRKDAVNQSLESLSVSYRRIPAEQNLPTARLVLGVVSRCGDERRKVEGGSQEAR